MRVIDDEEYEKNKVFHVVLEDPQVVGSGTCSSPLPLLSVPPSHLPLPALRYAPCSLTMCSMLIFSLSQMVAICGQ